MSIMQHEEASTGAVGLDLEQALTYTRAASQGLSAQSRVSKLVRVSRLFNESPVPVRPFEEIIELAGIYSVQGSLEPEAEVSQG